MGAHTTTRERVGLLHDRGKTVLEISFELHISPQMVYRHLKKLDLTPNTGKATA